MNAMYMQTVLTVKGHIIVNATMDFLEMGKIVQVLHISNLYHYQTSICKLLVKIEFSLSIWHFHKMSINSQNVIK